MSARTLPDTESTFYFLISPDRDWCDTAVGEWPEAFLPAIRAAITSKGLLMDEYDYYLSDHPVDCLTGEGRAAEDSKERLSVSVDGQNVCTLYIYQRERESQPTKD